MCLLLFFFCLLLDSHHNKFFLSLICISVLSRWLCWSQATFMCWLIIQALWKPYSLHFQSQAFYGWGGKDHKWNDLSRWQCYKIFFQIPRFLDRFSLFQISIGCDWQFSTACIIDFWFVLWRIFKFSIERWRFLEKMIKEIAIVYVWVLCVMRQVMIKFKFCSNLISSWQWKYSEFFSSYHLFMPGDKNSNVSNIKP